MALAFAANRAARHSQVPHDSLQMGRGLRGFLTLRPVELAASLVDLTTCINFRLGFANTCTRGTDNSVYTLLSVPR